MKLLARAAILFGLSMILVFGFWEHRNFYQFGLPLLLVGGGLVTFLVILAFRMAISGQFPHGRDKGEVVMSAMEGDGLRRGTTEMLIRRAEDLNLLIVGRIVRGRYDTGKDFGRLRVLDGTRKRLADVTDEEARKAGYRSAAELCGATGMGRGQDLVAVLRVERVGGPP